MDSIVSEIGSIPLQHIIILALSIFSIGLLGVVIRKNTIIIFMSIELMLNAVNFLLVGFSVHHNDSSAQVFVFFIMALAAAEIAIGLAVIVMVHKNVGSIEINDLNKLKK